MKELVGKHIVKVNINSERTLLHFLTKDGESFFYGTAGDCCSKSWYEHFSGIDYLLNSTIVSIEDVDMSSLNIGNHPEHDYLQVYGIKIKTNKGYADIEFRNSSNGYYGGSIERIDPRSIELDDLKYELEE